MEKFGLIGHPIAHSESPAVFAAAYGGRWPYDLIEGEDFELSWKRFLDGYRAINITAPFKELAFRKLLECGVVDESVRSIGAVNIAVKEAVKLGVPVVALVDSNCNPDGIDYVIPGNDDALRSIKVIMDALQAAVQEGVEVVSKKRASKAEKAAEEPAPAPAEA